MRLHLLHRTGFVYDGFARDSFNECRLQPGDGPGQTVSNFRFTTAPPSNLQAFRDYYGNFAHRFAIAAAHQSLAVQTEADVTTDPQLGKSALTDCPLQAPETTAAFESEVEFLQPSRYVPLDGELVETAREIPAETGGVWSAVEAACRFVHRTLVYRPQATGVETLATEALRLRAGVCQDFAHVAIGLCRSIGIPARYVSGYFYNPRRKPGESEASHAWMEAWLPSAGWTAFDPTHDRRVDERYIRLAIGRDYADIRPISGTYRGAPTREMRVEVQVSVAADQADLKAPAIAPG